MIKGTESLAQKERLRIQNSVQDKTSFIGRNVALQKILLYFLYPIAAIYSAFTGGSALKVYLDSIINNASLAVALAVLVALVVEVSKYFFGNAVSEDIRHHVFAESKNHIIAFFLKAVAFLGVFAFSITLSLTGASDVATDYRETTTPVDFQLVSLDSINAYYDAQIISERDDIAAAKKTTWRGRMVEDAREIIKQSKAIIADYESKRTTAINAAQATNAETIAQYDAETKKAGGWLRSFAGLGEVLSIVILIFVGNYESGATKEVEALTESSNSDTNSDMTAAVNAIPNSQVFSQNTTQRQRIGFQIPNSDTNSGRYNSGKGKVKIGKCLHCGDDYEQVVWNKKFCSDDCRLDHHAAKHNGKRFSAKRYHNKK